MCHMGNYDKTINATLPWYRHYCYSLNSSPQMRKHTHDYYIYEYKPLQRSVIYNINTLSVARCYLPVFIGHIKSTVHGALEFTSWEMENV